MIHEKERDRQLYVQQSLRAFKCIQNRFPGVVLNSQFCIPSVGSRDGIPGLETTAHVVCMPLRVKHLSRLELTSLSPCNLMFALYS